MDDVIAKVRSSLPVEIASLPDAGPAAAHMPETRSDLAALIDHTLLRPDATWRDAQAACRLAAEEGCAAVCLSSRYVAQAAAELRGSVVKVCTVIGFPHGADAAAVKAFAAAQAVAQGADEVDMVLSLGALRAGDDEGVFREIRFIRSAMPGRTLKVILETAVLADEEIVRAALIAVAAGADFVKTSTGYGGGGATAEAVALLRRSVGGLSGIKASGGISTLEQAEAMLRAGATRLGMSRTAEVLRAMAGGR
jgi:deoxyribose-phosphate aldolase